MQTFFEARLRNAIVPLPLAQAEISLIQNWHNLLKLTQQRLVTVSKQCFLGHVRTVPIERGEVSAGGVSLQTVSPRTMQSRLVQNLYFAGEVLDVAGEVGGFNMQAAYSTGWVASNYVATQILARSHSKL